MEEFKLKTGIHKYYFCRRVKYLFDINIIIAKWWEKHYNNPLGPNNFEAVQIFKSHENNKGLLIYFLTSTIILHIPSGNVFASHTHQRVAHSNGKILFAYTAGRWQYTNFLDLNLLRISNKIVMCVLRIVFAWYIRRLWSYHCCTLEYIV